MTIDELLNAIFDSKTHPTYNRFEGWLKNSRRFRAFAERYPGKIRKKLRTVQGEAGRRDIEAELEAAYWLVQDVRCAVEYEKLAPEKQRGPDFTVTFRANTIFHVEVTRLRAAPENTLDPQPALARKLIDSVCDKLGQLQPSAANILAITAEDPIEESDLAETMRTLKLLAEKDERFLAWAGFQNSSDFFRQFNRLSAIWLRQPETTRLWINPQAKHALPKELGALLLSAPSS